MPTLLTSKPEDACCHTAEGDPDPAQITNSEFWRLSTPLEAEISSGADDPEAALRRLASWIDYPGRSLEFPRVTIVSESRAAARISVQSASRPSDVAVAALEKRFSIPCDTDFLSEMERASLETRKSSIVSEGREAAQVRPSDFTAHPLKKKKSSISFDTDSLCNMESSVSDVCVIVVGAGEQAFELARARLKAHGRLAMLWTTVPPSGTFEGSEFTWLPPTCDQKLFQAGFQRLFRSISCKPKDTGVREAQWKLGAFEARSFCKAGPDVVALGPGERYEIAKTKGSDKLGGIRVLKGDETIWAITGAVVLAVSAAPQANMVDDRRRQRHAVCAAPPVNMDDNIWALTGAVVNIGMAVDNKCAQPVPLPTPERVFICMVVEFAILFLQTLAPTLHSPFKKVPTFWSALWYAAGALFFAYSVIDKWVGPSLCGVACATNGLKIASCTVQCVVAIVLYCVPVYKGSYPVEFLISCVNTSVLLISCSLLHCFLVREPPRYWKWWAFQCFGPLWLGFAGFYSICVIYTYIGAGLEAPIAAAVFLPISLSIMESFAVYMTCHCYRFFSYEINAAGDQAMGIPMAIGLFHGLAEGARLSATLLGAVRTGSYSWILSAILGLLLNLFSRFGWSRYYLMRLLNTISPSLRNLIIPSMCSRVHDETKFLLGYVRYLTPVVMGIARSSQGKSPFSGLSGLLVVIVAFVSEIVEDAVVRQELLPYAKPMKKFTDLAGVYKSYGHFNPLQIFVMSERHARQARPMMLHGMRALSLSLTMCLVIPSCVFPVNLFHAYVGRGYMSGLCEDPIGNPLTLGLILQEWPPSC